MEAPSYKRDGWLALRCQAGEPTAFSDLVASMERPLFYYALKLTRREDVALDILQETWLRAFRSIRNLKEPERLRAWLYTLAHGIFVDVVRRDNVRARVEEEHAAAFDEAIPDEALATDNMAAVHDALDQLEPHLREVLVLHFLEDFPISEISRIVGCPEGTVKSRLHYAKKAIKIILTRGNL